MTSRVVTASPAAPRAGRAKPATTAGFGSDEPHGVRVAPLALVRPTLEVEILVDGELVQTETFTEFPVRIGRDETSDLHLPFGIVSRRHARVEAEAGSLVLVDEGGRNGMFCDGALLSPGDRIPFTDTVAFEIVGLRPRESVVVKLRAREHTQLMSFHEPANENATSLYADPDAAPETIARVGEAMEEFRSRRTDAVAAIVGSFRTIPEPLRADMARQLVSLHPDIAADEELAAALASSAGTEIGRSTRELPPDAEASLRGVRRLATRFVPSAEGQLEDAASIDAFVGAIESSLRMLLVAATEIDFVYRCEAGEGERRDPAEKLARELLDWRQDVAAATHRVHNRFVEIAAHHAALVTDVERALQRLVGDLSPAAIEWAARSSRWHGPFWPRTLWHELRRRHEQIATECEARFGPRFLRVAAALRGTTMPRLNAGAPNEAARARRSGWADEREVTSSADEPPSDDEHWPFACAFAWDDAAFTRDPAQSVV